MAVPQQAIQASVDEQQNNKFYRNQPNSKKPNEYVTSHESSLRSKNRFQPIGYSTSATATPITASTTRRVRFNPWRSTTLASLVPVAQAQVVNAHGLQSLPRQPLFGNKERGASIPTNNVRQSFDPTSVTNNNKKNEDELDDDNVKDVLDDIDDYYYDSEKDNAKEPVRESVSDDLSINPVSFVKQDVESVDTNKTVRKIVDEVTEGSKVDTEQKRNVENTESSAVKEVNNEDGTVILHSNFYLPGNRGEDEEESEELKSNQNQKNKDETTDGYEYEYEYEDYDDQATTVPAIPNGQKEMVGEDVSTSEPDNLEDSKNDEVVGQAVVSVVTTKSVVNGSTANSDEILENTKSYDETDQKTSTPDIENGNNSTESWVVVASVQTSRSVSGARFLPFPQVEQEEKKQTLSELEENSKDEEELDNIQDEESTTISSIENLFDLHTTTEPENYPTLISTPIIGSTTEHLANMSHSTESIIDKLDRVQSELSSGLLTGKYPILNEMSSEITTTGVPVVIRKFSPRTSTISPRTSTIKTPEKKIAFEALPMDDLGGLLPSGFKPRNYSYRNKKPTTTTSTTIRSISDESVRSSNSSRSFKSNPVEQDLALAALLPKDYKLNAAQEPILLANKTKLSELLSKIKLEDEDPSKKVTKIPSGLVTVTDDINKFLPPGYKVKTTTPKMPATVKDSANISKFLPPGYKLPKAESTTKKSSAFIPVPDDISKFLPSGYKPPPGEKIAPAVIPVPNDVLSKLLPPGYKPIAEAKPDLPKVHKFSDDGTNTDNKADSILNKLKFADVSALLPPGFKPDEDKIEESSTESKPVTKSSSSFKVVFPKGIGKRPTPRVTTQKPAPIEGPGQTDVTIRKGFPSRYFSIIQFKFLYSETHFSIKYFQSHH